MPELSALDSRIFALYVLALICVAYFVSREKAGHEKNTSDYFLAGNNLPWWAVGASLIAANISAEQIIGMSGSGYAIGLAIASYEWMAAITLILVGKYFLPIFLKHGIVTMPQFLETRFGGEVKLLLAIFWVVLYTSVNLTAVLWLGGLALNALTGWSVMYCMMGLATFAVLYSSYGGLKAVALTDIIQVIILVVGGAAITGILLSMVNGGGSMLGGFGVLMNDIPGHFKMILSPENPSYQDLPGIWTLLGGLWVLHFSYWGFNQYIIQRALGAESLQVALALAF